jgi:DNA replication protein DnaC
VTRVDARPDDTRPPEPVIAELEALCRRLRLRYIREEAPDVLRTAKAQRWEPAELLRVLLVAEADGRDRSTIENRRKAAHLPAGKTFDTWDGARSSIPAATQRALRSLEWVDRHENVVVAGPSGTGKSHLCEALGHAAITAGRRVVWFGVEDLGTLVRRHRVDDSIAKAFTPILRADLVLVDDIGMLPLSADAAEGLYRLVDAAYERRSLAISSNLHPSGFDQLMDRTIATALVDRLLHHAHVLVTDGDSIRLADTRGGPDRSSHRVDVGRNERGRAPAGERHGQRQGRAEHGVGPRLGPLEATGRRSQRGDLVGIDCRDGGGEAPAGVLRRQQIHVGGDPAREHCEADQRLCQGDPLQINEADGQRPVHPSGDVAMKLDETLRVSETIVLGSSAEGQRRAMGGVGGEQILTRLGVAVDGAHWFITARTAAYSAARVSAERCT